MEAKYEYQVFDPDRKKKVQGIEGLLDLMAAYVAKGVEELSDLVACTDLATAIAELEQQLKNVRVVAEVNTDSIGIGTKVMVRDLDFEEDIEYTLVGSNEADALENKISDQSPIGRAIIGAKVGDILSIAIPSGQMRIQILSISK